MQGLRVARESIADRGVPATYRAWLVHAVVLAEDPEGLERVAHAVRHARQSGELRQILAAIPVEIRAGADLVESVLRDHSASVAIRAAAGRALIRIASAQTISMVRSLAADPLTVWNLRAALLAELLAIGEVDLVLDGVTVLEDPSVTGAPAVALLESLIRSGETVVLQRARDMLSARNIDWLHRRRLAEAVIELGVDGVEMLRDLVDSAIAVDLKLRPIVALVQAGVAMDVANRVVGDTGAPAWIRTRVACALLKAGDQSMNSATLTELAHDPDLDHAFQAELIAAMAARDLPQAEAAAVELLEREARKAGSSYAGSQALTEALGTAGRGGLNLLSRIAGDTDLAEEDRAQAIIALAEVEPALAGKLAVPMLGGFTAFVRSRLVILLAERGSVGIAAELTALLATDLEAYTALFKLLESAWSNRALIEQLLPFGEETPQPLPRPETGVQLDDAYLEACGLSWSSVAQKKRLRSRIRGMLETQVGAKLFTFLTSGQVAEFNELSSDEERLEFLASRASGYEEMIDRQAAILQQEIRADTTIVDDREEQLPPLIRLAHTATLLAEWGEMITTNGQVAAAEFLIANRSFVVSPEALAVLELSCRMDSRYGLHEGLHFIVRTALDLGIPAASQFLVNSDHRHDIYCEILADSNGRELLHAGLAGLVLSPESASTYFYASLGAMISGLKELSVRLMRESDQYADDLQRAQGRTTIRREAERLGWTTVDTARLLDTLRPPMDGNDEQQVGPQ